MKRLLGLALVILAAVPAMGQVGERMLNRRYQNEIRDSLAGVVAERQREMQRYAEQTLTALPNEEKLYDEGYISVGVDLIDTFFADGRMRLDLVYRLSYNCKHIEGYTDDYPLGTYAVDSSNSCRAICNLTKAFVERDLGDVFATGGDVEVVVSSSADGTEFNTRIPYDGEYGEFRYCPVVFNGERLRVSVDRETGINNNCQLAYIRARAVRAWLEEHVTSLRRTGNVWRFVTQSFKDSVHTHYYRRSSVEIRVNDVFRETVDRMQGRLMEDEYVDYNVPVTGRVNKDMYVLIIANERYDAELIPDVPFADNDGTMDSVYFVRAIGVPHRQVKVLRNATKATIMKEGVHWLKDLALATATNKNEKNKVSPAEFFIYYAGHGFTDGEGRAYLVPNGINTEEIASLQGGKKGGCKLFGKKKKVETEDSTRYDIVLKKKEVRRLAEQCIAVDELCSWFNTKDMQLKSFTVIIDASFNGCGRDGKPIFRAEPQKDGKKKRGATLRGDAVVMLAAAYDKTAYSFDRLEHGFLTYFLLKEVKSKKEDIFRMSYQDIYEEVMRKVDRESALQNRWQEISGIAGGKYKDDWRNLKIVN